MAKQKTEPQPQRVAYLYSRVSSRQQTEGRGLSIQQDNGKALCEKRGWLIDRSLRLVDEGKSGFSGQHRSANAALGRFLELIREGRIRAGSVLVLDQLDRLSREDAEPAIRLFTEITQAGVWIATVDPEFVYERFDYTNGLMVLVEFMRAHSESRQKRRRQTDSWAKRRRQAAAGERIEVTGHPGWLRQKDGNTTTMAESWEVLQQHKETVLRMFDMAKEGTGCGLIAATLNAEKVPFWGRSAVGWTSRLVYDVLRSRRVLGEWQPHRFPNGRGTKKVPHGNPIKGFYPAIVTEAQWLAVQAAMDRRTHQRGPVVRNRNLFSGMLTEAVNQAGMYLTESNGTLVLKSGIRYSKPGMKRGTVPTIEYDRVSSAVAQMITVMPHIPDTDNGGQRLKELSAEEQAAAERLKALQSRYLTGGGNDTPEHALDLMDQLAGRMEELRTQIDAERMRLSDRPAEAAGQLVSLWALVANSQSEDRERIDRRIRSLVREVVDRIYLAIHHGEVMKRHPKRSFLLEIVYRNGRVQQAYSPPAVKPLDWYECEELFVWTVAEPSTPKLPPVIAANRRAVVPADQTDAEIGAVVIDRPRYVPQLADGITAQRLAEAVERLRRQLVVKPLEAARKVVESE